MNIPAKTKPPRARQSFFQFTQQIEYGLFLLAVLAVEEETGVRSIRTIANDTGLSFSFLQKVANRLKKAGIIKAIRGKQGGFQIARKAHSIFLGEVIEALEGPIRIMSCLDAKRAKSHHCPTQELCAMKSRFGQVNHEVRTHYLSKPLSELIA